MGVAVRLAPQRTVVAGPRLSDVRGRVARVLPRPCRTGGGTARERHAGLHAARQSSSRRARQLGQPRCGPSAARRRRSRSRPVTQAMSLAPENADVALLAARMEIARGRLDEAIVQHAPRDARSINPASKPASRSRRSSNAPARPKADAEALRLLDELPAVAPDNMAVLLERARVAAKRRDRNAPGDSVARLENAARSWPAVALEQHEALRRQRIGAATSHRPRAARRCCEMCSRACLALPPTWRPCEHAPKSSPSHSNSSSRCDLRGDSRTPDMASALRARGSTPRPALPFLPSRWTVPGAPSSSRADPIGDPARRRRQAARGRFLARACATVGAISLLALDWNNDFKVDLLPAGRGGVGCCSRGPTADSKMPRHVAAAGARRVVPLPRRMGRRHRDGRRPRRRARRRRGATMVLRNNGDGTWSAAADVSATSRHCGVRMGRPGSRRRS